MEMTNDNREDFLTLTFEFSAKRTCDSVTKQTETERERERGFLSSEIKALKMQWVVVGSRRGCKMKVSKCKKQNMYQKANNHWKYRASVEFWWGSSFRVFFFFKQGHDSNRENRLSALLHSKRCLVSVSRETPKEKHKIKIQRLTK